jgi:hypothetical protein
MGDRLTAGRQTLDLSIKVRILVPQYQMPPVQVGAFFIGRIFYVSSLFLLHFEMRLC